MPCSPRPSPMFSPPRSAMLPFAMISYPKVALPFFPQQIYSPAKLMRRPFLLLAIGAGAGLSPVVGLRCATRVNSVPQHVEPNAFAPPTTCRTPAGWSYFLAIQAVHTCSTASQQPAARSFPVQLQCGSELRL